MPDYLVVTTIPTSPDKDAVLATKERLVRSKNEARAIAHVVQDTVYISRTSVDDVVRLTKSGAEVEIAE